MTDASTAPPATKADVERLGTENAGRAQVLHEELIHELQQQLAEIEVAMANIVRAEVEHSVQVQRSEFRLLHQTLADNGSSLADLAGHLDRMAGHRVQRAALALLVTTAVGVVLFVAAIAVTVIG